MKIFIVGGGAAGLVAAIVAKRKHPEHDIVILEGNDRVGKKILITGNGQCNLTHEGICEDFYRGDIPYAAPILEEYTDREIIAFFEELGALVLTREDGKAYPYSLQAGSVVDLLRFAAEKAGVEISVNERVKNMEYNKGGFRIYTARGDVLDGDRVLIACGGMAAPHTGSDGGGYALLQKFGHKLTPLFPALVPLTCESKLLGSVKGLKCDALATLFDGGEVVRKEYGEVVFQDYGLSGPPVLQLSSELSGIRKPYLSLDLMPEVSEEETYQMLSLRKEAHEDWSLEQFFTGVFHKRLGMALMKEADVLPFSRKAWSLSERDVRELARTAHAWRFRVTGTLPWERAQVTGGGISMQDFNMYTLESTLRKGLYAAGEVLNIDGDCGGYNLHWAWASGMAVGNAIGN